MNPKFDIFLAVPGLAFDGDTVAHKSLGGSESAGYYMARELAALGHRLTVFTNVDKQSEADEVNYLPLSRWRQYAYATPHDVSIIQRLPAMFSTPVYSRLNLLWCHDLALARSSHEVKGVAWNLDKIIVLSEFMKRQYQEVHGLPEELLYQTRNGVDLGLVARAQAEIDQAARDNANLSNARDRKRLVYMARPERGLDILLERVMPQLLANDPEISLALCWYDNQVDELKPFYDRCARAAAALGDRVKHFGHLKKLDLYKLMLTSGGYIYPTPSPISPTFSEVSCIAVMEAQACGLPVVCSANGALPETLSGGAFVAVQGTPGTPAHDDAMVGAVLAYTGDRSHQETASRKAAQHAKDAYGWRPVAEKWAEMIEREMRARSSDKVSLAYHFYRRSDIVALKQVLATQPADDHAFDHLREVVAKHYAFMDAQEGYKEQYEKIGDTHDDRVIDWAPREQRYGVLRQWLQETPGVKTVLDYGCAHGAYAVNLLKELPDIRICGVDIDRAGIALANRFAGERGVAGRARFEVRTHEDLPFASAKPAGLDEEGAHVVDVELFDAVVAQEVLEHVPEPWKLIEKLEERCKVGGWMYLTVPFGPWEYSSYHTYPHRAHVWEFDVHDIREMLKGKKNVRVASLPAWASPETGELLGWWVIRWQKTEGEHGAHPIDLYRKLWLQAPRQSVSANIMAGPGSEDSLHWCLKSLQTVADETVIVNCGLGEEALRILAQYEKFNVRVVPGADPKQVGFETPRNMGLPHCHGQFILWIDTDEKLVRPDNLTKYLRHNVFAGYSIKQHHFAVDTTFDPDMPVRVFRRSSGAKWFGMIHEHPEKALNEGVGLSLLIPEVNIAHVGYLEEGGRQMRFLRNAPLLEMDKQKYPNRLLQKTFIMRDNMIRIGYELRRNGGIVTEPMRELAREVRDLWRAHFKGKTLLLASDPLDYYTQALEILGEGFAAGLHVSAGKDQAPINGVKRARFADMDDFEAHILAQARDVAAPFQTRYWG